MNFITFSRNLFCIHNLIRKLITNSLFLSEITVPKFFLWRINYQFRKFTMVTLSLSPIDHVLTIFFVVSLWIECFFTKILFIRYRCRVFIIFYANSSWIHEKTLNSLFFREITIYLFFENSLWVYFFSFELTINSLSVTRIHYESIRISMNHLYIHYLFCE